jgi:tetratricopeptide (TPR) repeat protein/DNA-binding CsgD family transcriptional regulator
MIKRALAIILIALAYNSASAKDAVRELLQLDMTYRSDSMLRWYKTNIRDRDSASAFRFFDELEQIARADKNAFAHAEALFLKGQYTTIRLRRRDEGIGYMQKAIEFAKTEKLDYDWADYSVNLGNIYFSLDNVPLAIECLIRAHEQFDHLGYEHNRNASQYLYSIGLTYYQLKNYKEALKYFLMAQRYPNPDFWIAEQTENGLGLVYFELGMPDSAIYYYSKTIDIAAQNKDTAWIGIANGNIGDIYMKQKDHDKAYEYFDKYYRVCKTRGMLKGNTAGALTSLAEINIIRNNIPLALQQLTEAGAIVEAGGKDLYPRRGALYQAFAKLYSIKGDYTNAYKYLLMSKEVSDSMARKENALRYVNVQQQLESEKHMAQVSLLEAQKRAEKQKQYFYLAGLAALSAIGFLIYNRNRLKAQKDLEIKDKQARLLISEKLRTEDELKNAQTLLQQYVRSIAQKNQLIEEVTEQLNTVSEKSVEPIRSEYIQQLADATLLTDKDWNEFKELFVKVHKGFFIKLKEKVPDLTEADMRVLALTKLNINTKQMAQMLGISPSSVHTARYRLRKKMSLPEESQLEELVEQI